MSNFQIDDIRLKIQSLKQQKNENRENAKNDFPFTEITRDTLNKYKKGNTIFN
jgi:hypothetical protein